MRKRSRESQKQTGRKRGGETEISREDIKTKHQEDRDIKRKDIKRRDKDTRTSLDQDIERGGKKEIDKGRKRQRGRHGERDTDTE